MIAIPFLLILIGVLVKANCERKKIDDYISHLPQEEFEEAKADGSPAP